ncbi:hypothetical protein Ccel01_16260 [Cellulosimicrobium cellulans]|uniref:Uncharacterized protein n=1 Tax=Cellulosimicrobium cellulans TaxID=1710 RepID=A0AAV5P357_CELCE|nr:hypothetical protein Ccel01_16260 [Cellulosimicrobium cellulans]
MKWGSTLASGASATDAAGKDARGRGPLGFAARSTLLNALAPLPTARHHTNEPSCTGLLHDSVRVG